MYVQQQEVKIKNIFMNFFYFYEFFIFMNFL